MNDIVNYNTGGPLEFPSLATVAVDRHSPIPLYHQIAEALRYRIATGDIAPGGRLPSLRAGAERWGVNLHTVRRAYRELQEAGLVETRAPQGTTVLSRGEDAEGAVEDLTALAAAAAETAHRRFGAEPADLIAALYRLEGEAATGRRRVSVLECSRALAEGLARQLMARWPVAARAWPLAEAGEAPEGDIVATYFHYNEVRESLSARPGDLQFVAIRPDPAILERLRACRPREGRARIVLCETDEAMAHNIAIDLRALLPDHEFMIEVRLPADPSDLLGESGVQGVLFSPRSWDRLAARERSRDEAHELTYVIDPGDLERVGREFGWAQLARPSRPVSAGRA